MKKFVVILSVIACFVVWNNTLTGCGRVIETESAAEATNNNNAEATTGSEPGKEPGAEPTTGPEPGAEPSTGPEPGPEPSTGPEPGPEPSTGPEAGPEAGPEGSTGPEAGPEGSTGPETSPEGSTGPEVGPEGSTGPEVTPDASVGPEAGPEGSTGPEVGPEGSTGPETVPEFSGSGPDPNAATQITAIRAGTAGKIGKAAVTYLKPKVGSDKAGFFVQATKTGPALFVAVDPGTLTPKVKVGDIVSFDVTKVNTNAASQNRVEAETISNLKVDSSGYDVNLLAQDVSTSTDLVSSLDNYADELISFDAKVVGDIGGAGSGFSAFQIDTKGVTANTDLKLRFPAANSSSKALNILVGLSKGCDFSVKNVPMWRFRTTAQPSPFVPGEITVKTCPAAKLISARATNATTVVLTFDRPLDKTTINTNGSDFAFDNGLSATAAKVDVNTVELTTGTQDGTKTYKVTASAAIKDNLGKTLDSTGLSTTFKGFNSPAIVLINEVSVQLANGCDMVELRVKQGGSLDGFKLMNGTSTSLTFQGLVVKKNDYILVHYDAKDTKCYPTIPKNETTGPKEVAFDATNFPTNVDTAYDWYTTSSGLSGSTAFVTLKDGSGKIVDAVMLSDLKATASNSSLGGANAALKDKQWGPVSGPAPASYDATSYKADAVTDIDTSSNDRTKGKTIQRKNNADTNNKSDWTDAEEQTWGKNNKGQTDF